MRDSRNLLSGKRKYLWGSLIVLFIAVICAAFSVTGNDKFDIARREVLLRKIGDELPCWSKSQTSDDHAVRSLRLRMTMPVVSDYRESSDPDQVAATPQPFNRPSAGL